MERSKAADYSVENVVPNGDVDSKIGTACSNKECRCDEPNNNSKTDDAGTTIGNDGDRETIKRDDSSNSMALMAMLFEEDKVERVKFLRTAAVCDDANASCSFGFLATAAAAIVAAGGWQRYFFFLQKTILPYVEFANLFLICLVAMGSTT